MTTIDICDDVLDHLVDDVDTLAAQTRQIGAYAVRWVVRRDGFEPSAVCVLRPLGQALEPLRAAIERWESTLVQEWTTVRAGVRACDERFAETDRAAGDRARLLVERLGATREPEAA